MFEIFLVWDEALFRWINTTWASGAGDAFFVFVTETKTMAVPYLLLIIGIVVAGKRKGLAAVLLLALVILCCDQFSSFVLKPLVGRVRPCTALEGVRLLVGCGGGKSFPSSHAVNNFGAAYLISAFFPRMRAPMYVLASAVALSRVYVGVHYPADVAAGALIGTGIAALLVLLYDVVQKRIPATPWMPARRTLTVPVAG